MTTSSTAPETVIALSGSSLGPLASGWTCFSTADVAVWLDTGTGGVLLNPGTQYTVAGADPLTGGISVTLDVSTRGGASWAAGAKATLQRATALDQPFSLGLNPSGAQIEAAVDHLSRQLQEIGYALLNRTMRTVPGDPLTALPPAQSRAGMKLGFSSGGSGGQPIAEP